MTRLRPAAPTDAPVIREMAFYAARWRTGQETDPPAPVLADDHVARYFEGWGRPGDLGVIADEHGWPVGAACVRLFSFDRPGSGFIDSSIPEVSIAVVPQRRGSGVGTALLTALLVAAAEPAARP
jgi:GNAT superfamily N-acetyltransferase